tara:strand:+ start:665 stop:1225 length:561 start_codon:yes stop_codon:yes gene_type:complete
MRKLLLIIVLGLLWLVPVNATEYNWKEIAKLNTPDIDLFLGGNIDEKSKDPLFKRLISNMDVFTYPDGVVLNDQTYFSKHGCRPQSCPEKGVVWINKKKKLFIGLIVHKYFENQEIDESISWFDLPIDYLFFSSSIKSFEEIPDQYWKYFSELEMDNLQYGYGNPNKVRFVGKELKITDVTKEFYK